MAGLMSLAYASVSKRVDAGRKALAFAFVQSGMLLGLALGPLFGSVVAAEAGLRGVFVTSSVLLAAAGLGLILLRRAELDALSRSPSSPGENRRP
jgi:MFS family permease